MDPVRVLRERAALTQKALARAARTSQPTIAAYEAGRKSPTVQTLQRLARAAGLQATIQYSSPLTREDRRSLELHRAIARHLLENPAAVIQRARRNLSLMRVRHGLATQLLREWDVILDRPVPALMEVLTDLGEWARDLRAVTPFGGVLSARERATVYREFRRVDGGVS